MIKFAKHIFFLLLSISFVVISSGQTKDEQIKLIRKKFQQINNDTALKKLTLENEEFLKDMTDNGGKLTGYYKDKKIKKVYEWVGLSNGISIRKFYFDNEQLIFVYEKFDSFVFDDKKNEFDFSKTKTIFEGRYYFNGKKLISRLAKGNKPFEDPNENPEKILPEDANRNLKSLDKKLAATLNKKLLIGHWVSVDDKLNHVIFSDTLKTELYDNEKVSSGKYWLEDDKLFAKDSDDDVIFEYDILSLSKTNLTLMSMARGNLLKFKRK